MKKLKDMSAVEVLEQIGVNICVNDINLFIKDKQKCQEFKDIINKNPDKDPYDVFKAFFKENNEYINNEKFILITLYRINNKEFLRRSAISNTRAEITTKVGKELLHGDKSIIAIIDEKDELKIISVDNLTGEAISNKNSERFEEIIQQVPVIEIVSKLHISDLEELICHDSRYGEMLKKYTMHKILKSTGKENYDYQELGNYFSSQEYTNRLKLELQKTLRTYPEYVSIDKLLLTSIYRNLEFLDKNTCNKQVYDKTEYLVKEMYKFVDEKTKIKGKVLRKDDEKQEIKEIQISYSAKDLKRRIDNNFINGVYYGDIKIEKIRSQIVNENISLGMYDQRVIELLGINSKEFSVLSDNDNNLKYLLESEMIDDKALENILLNRKNISADMIQYLIKNEKIDKQNVLDLYATGIVTLDTLRELKQNEELKIEEISSEEKLIKLYKEFNQNGESEEFTKYLYLFKELRLKDTNLENKKEIGQNLIEELDGDFEEEDLKKMYELGIISVETAIEWGGESITQNMFNQGILKPIDAKRLYKDNTLSIEMIKQVLRSTNLSDEDKLTLICSTFDSDEDSKIRMELIQYLNVDDKENKRDSNKKENRRISTELGSVTSKNAYITDPCMRWKLISLLDEEYSQEVCKDGYIIFKLPNVINGTIIIEKMFKKSQNGVIPSYGNATYILSETEFNKNQNNIINDNKMVKTINLSGLANLRGQEKADRLNHSNRWGNNIKEYFDVEKEESLYDEEKIEEIDKTIESIENSRTLK